MPALKRDALYQSRENTGHLYKVLRSGPKLTVVESRDLRGGWDGGERFTMTTRSAELLFFEPHVSFV